MADGELNRRKRLATAKLKSACLVLDQLNVDSLKTYGSLFYNIQQVYDAAGELEGIVSDLTGGLEDDEEN